MTISGKCLKDGLPLIRQCLSAVTDMLCFLLNLNDEGKSLSTIKVYLAAITAFYVGFKDHAVRQHPLIHRFMKGLAVL